MNKALSLLMIVKNDEKLLRAALDSVNGLVDQVVIVDNCSINHLSKALKDLRIKVYRKCTTNLGELRQYGLRKVTGEWVLMLDVDERVSKELKQEILDIKRKILNRKYSGSKGFLIPYKNHFLGRPVRYGGENYKILRLFKKKAVKIEAAHLHEKVELLNGKPGMLKNNILHYSYRSLSQIFSKFTQYGWRQAQDRVNRGERLSTKNLTLYPLHMFWARFIEDNGYKDGLLRIPLDLGFAYMEFLSYFCMFFLKPEKKEKGSIR